MAVVTTNLGTITAYGDAVAAGYTGTKAQWQALMANYATVGQQAAQDAQTASQAAQTATTKAGEASQSATAAAASAASITTPDATLTQAGVAADAKATGDEISDLKEGFTDLESELVSKATLSGNLIIVTPPEGSKITVSSDPQTEVKQYGKNIFPYDTIPTYTYAWAQIKTLDSLARKVLLKANHSYIMSAVKDSGVASWQIFAKAFQPDGTLISDNALLNYHPFTKTGMAVWNSAVSCWGAAANSASGLVFLAPTVDCWVDFVIKANCGIGNTPMIEVSDADESTEYEAYVLHDTKTVNTTAELTAVDGINTIVFDSGTGDVEYTSGSIVDDIDELRTELSAKIDSEDLEALQKRVLISEYASNLKGTGPVRLGDYSEGQVVDLSPLETEGMAHYTLLLDDIAEGEIFDVNLVDGGIARPYGFLDADKKLISMAYGATVTWLQIKVPSGAKYLLFQVGSAHLPNAHIIRHQALEYLSDGDKIGINDFNPIVEVNEKLAQASSIVKGDSTTQPKNRANYFGLLHFSDVHNDLANIHRLLDFAETHEDYIHDIIHTGDGVSTYFADTNPFSVIGAAEILNVIGNHECWIQGETWPRPYTATAQQTYEKFIEPYLSSWGVTSGGTNCCYYYKDYATAKVRLIVLDCIHYDATQESWFETALAGAKSNGYRVVAVTHYPAMTGITNIDCTFGTYGETISATTPPSGTDQVERMPESAFTCVDTFVANGGEFVCWLSGHTHADFIGTVTGHANQIQIVVTTARTSNSFGDSARVSKTKTQDAFNMFIVDGTHKLIKLVRIGADSDRYMRSRKTLCVNYATKQVISNT